MRTAIGYVCVSSDEQAEHGLGLEAQRQRVKAYCDLKGLNLANIYEDPGISGGKPLGTRSAGGRLLAEATHTKPVVVVARLDRLFRSVADAAQTIAEFDRYGVELVAIAEGFDIRNPYGRAMARHQRLAASRRKLHRISQRYIETDSLTCYRCWEMWNPVLTPSGSAAKHDICLAASHASRKTIRPT